MGLNTTRIISGEYVTLYANLTNVLSTAQRVNASYQWPMRGLTVGIGCYGGEYPFGVAVLEGYYNVQNISAGTPLDLSEPEGTGCPAIPVFSYYVFRPLSDVALATPPSGPTLKLQMNATIAVDGYWTGVAPPVPPGYAAAAFHRFGPGIYTVVAGDEWGNLVLLYFTVG